MIPATAQPNSHRTMPPARHAGMPPVTLAGEVARRVAKSVSARRDNNLHRLEFRAMGTHCRVSAHGAADAVMRDFQREVVDWVAAFEARYSRFIPDSLIGRINAAAGEHWVETDPETDRIFQLCQELFFFHPGFLRPQRVTPDPALELEANAAGSAGSRGNSSHP